MAVGKWFEGRTVLITGATGFLGKVLVAKLLADTKTTRLLLLVRSKRGVSPQERLKELLKCQILKRWSDSASDRLEVVEGDLCQRGLGLSEEWAARLKEQVSVVMHIAASVKFNDPLSDAIDSNVLATKQLITLAAEMQQIKVFIHVSTAYSNCNRIRAEEKYYPPKIAADELLKIRDKIDPATFEILSRKIIEDYPNTYTFSKSLAEDVVWEFKDKIPVAILRPSVVVSSWKEPEAGWSDSMTGVAALLVGGAKGVLQAVYCDPNTVADYVPVDIVARAVIVATWHIANNRYAVFKNPVFNITAMERMLSNQELMEVSHKFLKIHPTKDCLWNPNNFLTQNKTIYTTLVYIRQLLPALFIDAGLWLARKETKLLRLQRKIYVTMLAIGEFSTKTWKFDNEQLRKLNTLLPAEDVDTFDLDMEKIDLEKFVYDAFMGGKLHLLKEEPGCESEAKMQAWRLYVLDKSLQAVAGGIFIWLAVSSLMLELNIAAI